MDILVLSEMFPDPVRYQRGSYVVEEVRELSKLCNITVIAPLHLPLPRKKFRARRALVARIPVQSTLGTATVHRPRFLDAPRFSDYLNDSLMFLATVCCVRKHRVKVDLIHSHFAYPSGYVGAKLGQLLRKPVVLTVHGSDVHQRTRADHPYPLMRKRTLVALAEVDSIIAVSRALKARMVELGVASQKVAVIPGGFVRERFSVLDREEARRQLGLREEGPVILFVGSLVTIKGVDVLLEATAELRTAGADVRLIIVGDGPLRTQLKAKASQLGLDGSVLWAGPIPNEDVSRFMGACDVFVLPSLNEGLGLVCLEALACGRPVVGSRVGGIPEIITDSQFGMMVEPGNPQALACGIREALPRDWNPATLAAHVQDHDWQHIARRIYEQYEKVSELQ